MNQNSAHSHTSQGGLVPSSERGVVLLYVVWVVLLLSFFAAAVASRAHFALNLSDRFFDRLRATYAAQAAVHYAALALGRDATVAVDGLSETWSDNPALFDRHPFNGGLFSITGQGTGGTVRYGLEDEERRINLNTAPASVLTRLAQEVGGLTSEDAEALAAAIEDWRDEDDDERPSGAEAYYYRTRREPYDCKNGPLENLEELLLVRGVSPALYQAMEPYVTVYGSGRLNLNTAGSVVLRALGLSEAGVAGLRAFRGGDDGQEGSSDDRRLAALAGLETELRSYVPAQDTARLTQLAQEQLLSTHGEAFRAQIRAEHGEASSRVTVLAVLNRQGTIHLWSER